VTGMKKMEALFAGWAFTLQIILIIHFAVRKRFFETYTMRYGWIVYALSIPAAIISIILLAKGQGWYFWLGGFLFVLFAAFGYYVDYILAVPWRDPIVPRVMFPYVTLYLATIMFYWWPLWPISRLLWALYTVLYVIAMVLNIKSH